MTKPDQTSVTLEEDAAPSDPYWGLSKHIEHASTGERAALCRLQPDCLQPHQLAALSRALLKAGLAPETWQTSTWPRWALIAQGIALAGHNPKQRLGEQLASAGVSESRVTKLLTSRGDAFIQLLPRVVRLLASKGVAPNWRELGPLILKESSASRYVLEEAEQLRLRIAGPYFSAIAKAAKASD
jgi:CRISPR system Cascade subunit CasB